VKKMGMCDCRISRYDFLSEESKNEKHKQSENE